MLIAKNGTVLNVTRGAYMSLFKDKGWKPSKGSKKDKKKLSQPNFMVPHPNENKPSAEIESEVPFGNMIKAESLEERELEDDETYEVVLEEMTVKQLIEYAEENDIDLDGATRKDAIIRTIREVMEG